MNLRMTYQQMPDHICRCPRRCPRKGKPKGRVAGGYGRVILGTFMFLCLYVWVLFGD